MNRPPLHIIFAYLLGAAALLGFFSGYILAGGVFFIGWLVLVYVTVVIPTAIRALRHLPLCYRDETLNVGDPFYDVSALKAVLRLAIFPIAGVMLGLIIWSISPFS